LLYPPLYMNLPADIAVTKTDCKTRRTNPR
jgi:hypothetical protein